MGLVLEDQIVGDVVVRATGVDSSSTIEQSGRITRQIDSRRSKGMAWLILTQGRVCNRSRLLHSGTQASVR
jgi:hypothetical protein